MKRDLFLTSLERDAEMETRLRPDIADTPLKGVRSNIVQSIRAFRVQELQDSARALGQHFLYANLATAQSKQDVLDLLAQQFILPAHFGKNFDALYDCMTDPVHKSGPQPGFIVVLEQIPATASSTRKRASSCWTSSGTPPTTGRTGRSHSGASILFCSPFCTSQPSRTGERGSGQPDAPTAAPAVTETGEKMPTDKLVDVSPLALRMSSPFNAGYWLAAA
jgi:RNAse (barnase) inhibitor barstar